MTLKPTPIISEKAISTDFGASLESDLHPGLYIISVPIGNLQDITLRALNTLKKLDKIYCEDTRVTRKLLSLYQIDPPTLIRCDDYIQNCKDTSIIEEIKQDIQQNRSVGLVSDAGTPLISDPGYPIIAQLRQANLPIFPISGITAVIAALCVSGLPTATFQFKGFIPKKHKQRIALIDLMIQTADTYILYERPERIQDFLKLFPEKCQNYACFIAREITKMHETYYHAPLFDLLKIIEDMPSKGEAVLIINTQNISPEDQIDLEQEVIKLLQAGETVKDISQNLNLRQYASRNQLYELANRLKK